MVLNIGEFGYKAGKAYLAKQGAARATDDVQYSEKAQGSSKDLFSYMLVFDKNQDGRYDNAEIKAMTGINKDLQAIWDTDNNGYVDLKEAYIGMSFLEHADGTQNATVTQAGRNYVSSLTEADYRKELYNNRYDARNQAALDCWFEEYLKEIDKAGIKKDDITAQSPTNDVPNDLFNDIRIKILQYEGRIKNPAQEYLSPATGNGTGSNSQNIQMIENNTNNIKDGQYTNAGVKALVEYAKNDLAGLETYLKNLDASKVTEDGQADLDELIAYYVGQGDSPEKAQQQAENFMEAFDQNNDRKINATEHATSLALEDNPDGIKSKSASKIVAPDELDIDPNVPTLEHVNEMIGNDNFDLQFSLEDIKLVDPGGDGEVDLNHHPHDAAPFRLDGQSHHLGQLYLKMALEHNTGKVKKQAKELYKQFQQALGS